MQKIESNQKISILKRERKSKRTIRNVVIRTDTSGTNKRLAINDAALNSCVVNKRLNTTRHVLPDNVLPQSEHARAEQSIGGHVSHEPQQQQHQHDARRLDHVTSHVLLAMLSVGRFSSGHSAEHEQSRRVGIVERRRRPLLRRIFAGVDLFQEPFALRRDLYSIGPRANWRGSTQEFRSCFQQ